MSGLFRFESPRSVRRSALELSLTLALLVAFGTSLGCAFGEIRPGDPFGRQITLSDAQHRYTVLVRWSNFEEAAAFVAADTRDKFLADAPNFRELRFSEYESDDPAISDDGSATVDVTYYAYTLASPIEIRIHETQRWERTGLRNTWRVRSTFDGLSKLALAR